MGLFDLFKKKETPKNKVTVKFSETVNNINRYDPWQPQNQPRNDNYAILAFISLSKHGAAVGKTNDDYARKFSYEYKVYDPISYHKKVISDGYLEKADISIALAQLKVVQLKEILKSHSLPEKGKKSELIERIKENVNTASLGLDTYYIPSRKGWEHYNKYEHLYSVSRYGIDIDRYEEYEKKLNSHLKPNDVIWHILNDDFNKYNIRKDFGLARCSLFSMAQFLENENRHKQALLFYILVLYYDTSGLENNGRLEEPQYISLVPGLLIKLVNLSEHFDDSMIQQCYSRYKLPHHYISMTDFKRLVNDIFSDNLLDIKKYI